ncbi:MAG: tetratricopeptide repeat protein [Candidatus Bathyarchaeia archaeon]|jgi:tetratricopeptide (TPR) repeat protein
MGQQKGNGKKLDVITKSVLSSFDRYAQRYNERYIASLKAANESEKEQINYDYVKVDRLLSKRAFILGFYVYVLRKVVEDKQLMRERSNFTKASLISIFNQKGLRVKDVAEKLGHPLTRQESQAPYCRRQTQRFLKEDWRDAFYKQVDDKFTPFNSVFDSSPLPVTSTSETAESLIMASNLNTLTRPDLIAGLMSNFSMLSVVPDYLLDMRAFKEECVSLMAEEKKNLPNAYAAFLASDLNSFSPLFQTFYNHTSSIFAWKWFEKQTREYRQQMLDDGFPLEYFEEDATKAKEILEAMTSIEEVKFFLAIGAKEFVNRARDRTDLGYKDGPLMAKAAVALYEEYLKSSNLPTLDQAVIVENMAIAYRGSGNYKLMVSSMKKALELYEQVNDAYRTCVALKNLGEGEYYFGYKEKAIKYFKASEEISNKLDPVKRSDVFWNLACAFRRINEPKNELAYLKKGLALLPPSEEERSIQIENRVLELTDFI